MRDHVRPPRCTRESVVRFASLFQCDVSSSSSTAFFNLVSLFFGEDTPNLLPLCVWKQWNRETWDYEFFKSCLDWIVSSILAFEKYYSLGKRCLKSLSNSLILREIQTRHFPLRCSQIVSSKRTIFNSDFKSIHRYSHLSFVSLVCFLVDRFSRCSTFHHTMYYRLQFFQNHSSERKIWSNFKKLYSIFYKGRSNISLFFFFAFLFYSYDACQFIISYWIFDPFYAQVSHHRVDLAGKIY